jgi:hypothetical protein
VVGLGQIAAGRKRGGVPHLEPLLLMIDHEERAHYFILRRPTDL